MRQPTLLIVDDEESVLLTLQVILERAGYVITTAANAKEGLSVLSESAGFDGVITDMSMEHHQSGLEVARAATRLEPRPVIIIYTGYCDLESTKLALGTADYFAMKPFDVQEFKTVLARLLALRNDRLPANNSMYARRQGWL